MRSIAAILVLMMFAMCARAQESFGPDDVSDAVGVEIPADFDVVAPAVPETNLSEGLLVIDVPYYWNALCDAVVALAGVGWQIAFIGGIGWVLRKLLGAERAKEVMAAISVGVGHAWDDMGRELKRAAADKKFTADERQKLRNKAFEHAKVLLSESGKKLLESYSWTKVVDMISNAVQRRKAIANVSKGAASAASSTSA